MSSTRQFSAILLSVVAAATLLLAIGLAYSNTLHAPFVFDDFGNIVDNEFIRSFLPADVEKSSNPYAIHLALIRPIGLLSLQANYAWGGLDPFGYHVFNVCVHMLNGLLAWAVTARALRSTALAPVFGRQAVAVAWAVAMVWALHPLQTQAVTYTVQRLESLMSLFYLATLFCWIRAADQRSLFWYVMAFATCALGMGTKEVMITAPLVIFLYDGVFLARSWREALGRLPGLLALLIPAGVLLYQHEIVLPEVMQKFTTEGEDDPLVYLATQPHAVLHYLRLIVWPYPLVFDYDWTPTTGIRAVASYAAPLAILGVVTAGALIRRHPAGFAMAAFFIILSPSSSVIPLMHDYVVEHRAYLPSFPIVALLVLGSYRIAAHYIPAQDGFRSFMLGTELAVLLLCLGSLTYLRNDDYGSKLSLWSDTARKAPGNPRTQYNLGNALSRAGRLQESESAYLKSIDQNPYFPDAHRELVGLYMKMGDTERAEAAGRTAVRLLPKEPELRFQHALNLARLGRNAEAEGEYRTLLALSPKHVVALVNLGALLSKRGDLAGAEKAYRHALQVNPGDALARFNFAATLERKEVFSDAAAEYRRVATENPNDADARVGLARTLAQLGDMEKARAAIAEALRIDPGNAAAQAVNSILTGQ